jgi:UDP-N-acetylmuramoylalanine--D-glutamate ligase
MSSDVSIRDFRGRNILILGLGILGGGLGMARYCARYGARLRITDLRDEEKLRPALEALRDVQAEYVLGEHRAEDVEWADLVVRNPGVRPDHELLKLAEKLGKPVEMEIPYFVRHCPARLVAVTGTKGKTSTTTVLHQFLQAGGKTVHLAGNMGESAMALLDTLGPDDEVLLEVSSYQLEGLAGRGAPLRVAVITNVEDDHLDRYGDLETYRRVKASVAEGQSADDWLVLPAWDAELARLCARWPCHKVYVRRPGMGADPAVEHGAAAVVTIEDRAVRWQRPGGPSEVIADLRELTLLGAHNRVNVAFAAAAAYAYGREPRDISAAVPLLTPVAHRLEPVGRVDGIDFINDSAASAPVAVIAALEAVSDRRPVVIAGGVDKAADYTRMIDALVTAEVPLVLLPGSATDRLVAELDRRGRPAPARVSSMAEAVTVAYRLARELPADVVLLSPGAASHGLFVNEFDRGRQFGRAVDQLRVSSAEI